MLYFSYIACSTVLYIFPLDHWFTACGDLDRLSLGILWPITSANKIEEVLCSDINPSFKFGPTATRSCREDATWSRVDTSQCTISPTQQSTIIMYSTYVTVNSTEIISSPEIEQVSTLLYIIT